MKIPHLSPVSASSPSFALISVLALVSLAALTATAFLASARLERQATMPLTQTTILEMSLNAGANAAKEMLDYAPSKHFNFVTTYWRGAGTNDWTNELGYLLSGAVRSTSVRTSTIVNYYCCFSTATMTNLGTTASATIVVSNDITSQGTFLSQMTTFMFNQTNFTTNQSTNIPLLGDTPTNRCISPPVGWVYIKQDVRVKPGSTNTTNVPVARFAFFVQDLSGMIDAERMGGLTNGTPFRQSTALPTNYAQGTNPAEISLTNLTGTVLTNATNVSTFTSTNNRIKYLSPGMLVLTNGGGLNTNDLRYVTTGLRHWTNAYERIPVGLGYAHSWSNKCNLNINSNVTLVKITNVIGKNITMFTNRAGAMNSSAYIANISANIVDYIDTDSTPTSDNTNNPTYLGIENILWPNEIFDSILFKNSISTAPQLRIDLKDMVEVWNMGDKPIPSGTSISISNNYDMKLTFTNTLLSVGFTTNLASMQDVDNNNTTSWTKYRTFTTTNTIPPNGYAMLESDKKVNTTAHFTLGASLTNPAWYGSAAIRAAWCLYTPSNDATTNMAYKVKLGSGSSGQMIQATKDGRWTRYLAVGSKLTIQPTTPNTYVFCNNIGYASQTAINGVPAHTGGDPRAQLFLSGALYNQNYTNKYASPGGRNVGRLQLTSFPESEVNPAKFWPDNGHTTNSDLGGNPTLATQSPMTFSNTPSTNNWVMKRNDTGAMTNILELGNICDPMQWGDQSGSGIANQPGLWTNLTSSATNDSRFGGRNTLRIGRPEFTRFAWTNLAGATAVATPNMMMSSAPLLDLFSIADQYDESGQINLNTAPAPVLRALAGGIYLRSDPKLTGVGGSGASFPVPATMTEAFAQGVMRFRAKYPFYSPSQLSFIGTDPSWPNTNNWPNNAVFGNTNTITLDTNAPGNTFGPSARINVTEWNDQAAEEWFSKIFKLSTTYSRNFRVYVIAQKATNNGGVNIGVGPVVRKYYNVLTRQNSDAATDVPAASASTLNTFESSY